MRRYVPRAPDGALGNEDEAEPPLRRRGVRALRDGRLRARPPPRHQPFVSSLTVTEGVFSNRRRHMCRQEYSMLVSLTQSSWATASSRKSSARHRKHPSLENPNHLSLSNRLPPQTLGD